MNEKKYQPILSGVPFYFGTKNAPAATVRYVIKMKDDVDGEILYTAVQAAFERFPYLKKSLVRHGCNRYLVDNPAPIAVIHTSEQVTLNSPQTNNHLIAISWDGRYIYFNNSHGMMDGRGRKYILKALLYHYCSLRYQEDIQMEDILLSDSPVDPKEYEDAFEHPNLKVANKYRLPASLQTMKPSVPIHLAQAAGIKKTTHARMKLFRFDEKSFMKLCKSSDGTPNTAVSLVMFRALDKMYPNTKRLPVASVCVDVRNAVGAPKTHLSTTLYGKIAYDPKMRDMDFHEQNTVLRGQLMLTSDPDSQRKVSRLYSGIFHFVRALRIVPVKDFLMNTIVSRVSSDYSFMVSYAGKVSYGDCDKHIHGLVSCPYTGEAEILVELTVADGFFYVSWFQFWDEDIYLKAFIDELNSLGIPSEILAEDTIDGPKMLIP